MLNINDCTAYLSDFSIHRNDIDGRLSEAASPTDSGEVITAEDVPYPTTDWDLYLPQDCGNVFFTHGKGPAPKPSPLPYASPWDFSLEKFLMTGQNSTAREKSPALSQKVRRVEKSVPAHDIMSQISNILSQRWTETLDVSSNQTLRWTESSKSRGKKACIVTKNPKSQFPVLPLEQNNRESQEAHRARSLFETHSERCKLAVTERFKANRERRQSHDAIDQKPVPGTAPQKLLL